MREVLPALRFTRDGLLQALEARRPWATQYDAKQLAKHKKDEAAYFAKFQKAIKEAMKWDYAAARSHHFSAGVSTYPPQCPQSAVGQLDRVLDVLGNSQQKRFLIRDSGDWWRVYWLLTHDEKAKADMC